MRRFLRWCFSLLAPSAPHVRPSSYMGEDSRCDECGARAVPVFAVAGAWICFDCKHAGE